MQDPSLEPQITGAKAATLNLAEVEAGDQLNKNASKMKFNLFSNIGFE